jgi:transcriptional regulator with XRE-family HTH domain
METNIGQKIKNLRLTSDLTQEELANRAGLTKGFISQMENDKFQTSISIESLSDILDVLGISLSEFFSETESEQVVFKLSDRSQIDSTGASRFEMLVPGSTNNIMDPIMVELQPGEQLEKKDPHPGEQFGYVLKGTVTIVLNKEKHNVSKGNCFYFTSDKHHQMINVSKKPVTFLWVTTPPQM